MEKYVKKPIPVSAIQWTGKNFDEILDFSKGQCFKSDDYLWVKTREGELKAVIGDYIICGVEGEFYPCGESIFNKTYDLFDSVDVLFHEFAHKKMPVKSLHNTDTNGAKKNVKDIVFFGDGDTFKLISKASSEAEGWMKSTKAMEIEGVGCVVQTTTQQRNPDGSYALTDAVTFVPNSKIEEIWKINEEGESKVVGRKLVHKF